MKQHWWKILGVLLVVYGIVAGMLVPLRPNAIDVSPTSGKLGESLTVDVVGYNTRFLGADAGANVVGYLSNGEGGYVRSTQTQIRDDRRASFKFQLPKYLPRPDQDRLEMSLFISNPTDGTFVVPRAITVRQTTPVPNDAQTKLGWIALEDLSPGFAPNESITFPYRSLLAETIRNTYFHVSLWFAMMFIFIAAFYQSIMHLKSLKVIDDVLPLTTTVTKAEDHDLKALSYTGIGLLFGTLGLLTGALWAKYTWGSFWNWDIKQFTTLIALLIYCGYFVLRSSFQDPEQRGRLAASYNIFAFVCLIPLIYVLPRLSGNSLHPGASGNPGFGGEDLDNTMRMVFYPIIIGWTLFGFWMGRVAYRLRRLRRQLEY